MPREPSTLRVLMVMMHANQMHARLKTAQALLLKLLLASAVAAAVPAGSNPDAARALAAENSPAGSPEAERKGAALLGQ